MNLFRTDLYTIPREIKLRVLFLITLLGGFSAAYGHPGKLDEQGGHYDKNLEGYHCHQEPCFRCEAVSNIDQ